ncbi:MAG TPA: UDP-2,3-diacylglucosamine diphosphatase LpxI [Candidatus Sumerlaeota bacterium]|nr:MAG: hypothetical protein BWZ08_02414 [candidate division BRC1 bacterium ADurb.BinA292]HOE97246.1 UDP-2,3-diacylglucosamine diphosphatase LpxI [Candidatus Sumerlaeota bacterium]HOR29486.1 UDP-2,3-diacylglucosamine diphosphatase LpxI [Candidatus Sumerlaeota bacterium]HPK03913.1 UDP-2,3-diacylglucosamine diphosphatase LpxI [Candidatus Sumerlaeota bacterium]
MSATADLHSLDYATPLDPLTLRHIGLIAGEGRFPILLAQAARDRGISVTAVGINGITSPELADYVDTMRWVEFGQFNRLIQICHEHNIRQAIMAGRVKHRSIFQISKMDGRGMKLLARSVSRKADDLLGAVTREFAIENIEMLDSTLLLRQCMPPSGLLTPNCPPTQEILDDIEFGKPLANAIAGHDIGQTIVVKQGAVIAVEAMEGTNQTILRAGEIAGEGCVVVKVAKPRQDRRFDVPVLGLTTVKKLIQARGRAIAFPGSQALFFEVEEAVALAESRGITLLAW